MNKEELRQELIKKEEYIKKIEMGWDAAQEKVCELTRTIRELLNKN